MRVAVIGSGPAGTACAKALIRRGLVPTMIDVGEMIPSDRQAIVDRMARSDPTEWTREDRDRITANPTLTGPGIPQKMVFGSDFHFGRDRAFSPTSADDGLPTATFAKGGYSVAWGAAVLPAHDDDLEDWPIRRSDLEMSYRRVLADLPLSGAADDLERGFPLFKDHVRPLPLSSDAQILLRDLGRLTSDEHSLNFLSGQSRLVVNASSCRRCGLCLSGCVYGAIHSAADDVAALERAGTLRYRSQRAVQTLAFEDGAVKVTMIPTDGGPGEVEYFDRVFLAAGAIQSTRIALASLRLFGEKVVMKDSQKFILPLLRRSRTRLDWPEGVSLAQVFVDFKVPAVSSHFVHVQISSVNDYVLQRLGIRPWAASLRRRVLAPFYERLLIAWCGLHSDHSSAIELSLTQPDAPLFLLKLTRLINPQAAVSARLAARYFARRIWPTGTYAIPGTLMIGAPGGGNHFGGTMPMRLHRRSRLETDILGRLNDLPNVHIVDGSVLPSIPATTLALLQMANADRIASAVDL